MRGKRVGVEETQGVKFSKSQPRLFEGKIEQIFEINEIIRASGKSF